MSSYSRWIRFIREFLMKYEWEENFQQRRISKINLLHVQGRAERINRPDMSRLQRCWWVQQDLAWLGNENYKSDTVKITLRNPLTKTGSTSLENHFSFEKLADFERAGHSVDWRRHRHSPEIKDTYCDQIFIFQHLSYHFGSSAEDVRHCAFDAFIHVRFERGASHPL